MRRRAAMARSFGSDTRAKMNAYLVFSVLLVAGSAVGYNVRREAPYNNVGYVDSYYSGAGNANIYPERSQRLFWGEQGSNQVGGTGLWATLTNKFPFLGNMFGRMELANEYGVPGQISSLSNTYGVPNYQTQYQAPQVSQLRYQPQYQAPQVEQLRYQTQYQAPLVDQLRYQTQYQAPQVNQLRYQAQYQVPQVDQFYQQPRQYQQQQQFGQRFVPFGRDVGVTDDAVIVTPPFVPIGPQPAPAPAPAPIPAPQPQPVAPSEGYNYDKPQYRLELPHK